MSRIIRLPSAFAFLLATLLAACGSAQKVTLYTLDDARPVQIGRQASPSLAVISASLPELVDRSQLVLRNGANQAILSDQHRWAETLRRAIPRRMAEDLGHLLDSSHVVAFPGDVQTLNPDFRLSLDVQRFDATVSGVDVDILWRLMPRSGLAKSGRCAVHEEVAKASEGEAPYADVVVAQRRALARIAQEIASAVQAMPETEPAVRP